MPKPMAGACPGPEAKPIPWQDNQRLSSSLSNSREAVSSGQELRFPTPGARSCHAGISRYHGQHIGTDHVTANHQNLQRSRAFVSQRTKCIGPLSCFTWETRKMKQTCLNCAQQQEKGGGKSGVCSSGVSLGLQPVPGHAERQGTHACLSTLGSPTAFCIPSFLDRGGRLVHVALLPSHHAAQGFKGNPLPLTPSPCPFQQGLWSLPNTG